MRALSQDQRRRARTTACRIPALLCVQCVHPNRPAFRRFQYPTSPLGSYVSGFPDDLAFEEWLVRVDAMADAHQRINSGEHISGPAADTYRNRVTAATTNTPDLRKEFGDQRQAANGVPAACQHLQGKTADLEAANRRLRAANAELTERVDVYAQVIRELAAELDRARHNAALPDNVRRLPTPR
jgi:hypothetical protein